jgi:HEPN domain-containing protein
MFAKAPTPVEGAVSMTQSAVEVLTKAALGAFAAEGPAEHPLAPLADAAMAQPKELAMSFRDRYLEGINETSIG